MDSFGIVFSFFILSKFTIGSRYDCNRFSLHLHLILVTFKVKDKRLMKRIVLLIFGWLSVMTGFAADKPTLLTQVDQQKMMAWTDSVFNTLSMDERIGQLFMVIADVKATNQNMQRLLVFRRGARDFLFTPFPATWLQTIEKEAAYTLYYIRKTYLCPRYEERKNRDIRQSDCQRAFAALGSRPAPPPCGRDAVLPLAG